LEEIGQPHVILLGDSLLPVRADLPDGSLEDVVMPGLRFPWKLSVISAAEVSTPGGPGTPIPEDATHIVINIEGNDAIAASGLLDGPPIAWRAGLAQLNGAADDFERHVEILARAALSTRLPTLACTMYPPRYPEWEQQQAACAALAVFNDRILKSAVAAGFSIADLRQLGSFAELYASPTQLSLPGLQRVAEIIRRGLDVISRETSRSQVFF
jgi:hypothetical protein